MCPHPNRENLAGLVERITFHNEDSSFCVLKIKARGQRDVITVVGHAAAIGDGEFVQASGRWVNDRTYCVQFRADFLRSAAPTTAEGGEAVFDVVEGDPKRLQEVDGISRTS